MSTENRVDQTFPVSASPRLYLSNVRGIVTVQSHAQDTIEVTAIKHVDGRRHPERTEIQMHQDGNHVAVKTHYQREGADLFSRWNGDEVCAVDYIVSVPTHVDVDLHQVSGTLHVSGVTGRVKINAVQGAVKLEEINGHTHLQAVNAAVDGRNWRGQAKISTVSGPVYIGAAQLSHIKANTVSADLLFETDIDAGGRYDLHSVSGDVTLLLPPECGLDSSGATISGNLICDLPHRFSRSSRAGWQAVINGGGPLVRFSSISGDLELLAQRPAA
jgi:DUF4097 and DUF4098 domain-containing protein YvlB